MRGGWRSFEKHDFRERGTNQSVEENSGVEEEEEIEGFERAVCGVEVRFENLRCSQMDWLIWVAMECVGLRMRSTWTVEIE